MLISDLPIVIIRSLIITLLVEVIIAYLLRYRKKDLINIFLANIFTNPLLNSLTVYIHFHYGLKWRNIVLFFLEIIVVIVEGIIYRKYLQARKINGYILSLILNILSFIIGMIINNLIY